MTTSWKLVPLDFLVDMLVTNNSWIQSTGSSKIPPAVASRTASAGNVLLAFAAVDAVAAAVVVSASARYFRCGSSSSSVSTVASHSPGSGAEHTNCTALACAASGGSYRDSAAPKMESKMEIFLFQSGHTESRLRKSSVQVRVQHN